MITGRIFFIETVPHIVFEDNGRMKTRRVYEYEKNTGTGKIRMNGKMETVIFYN